MGQKRDPEHFLSCNQKCCFEAENVAKKHIDSAASRSSLCLNDIPLRPPGGQKPLMALGKL
jgi:hypothetical protein